jgi:hypothetical protein
METGTIGGAQSCKNDQQSKLHFESKVNGLLIVLDE